MGNYFGKSYNDQFLESYEFIKKHAGCMDCLKNDPTLLTKYNDKIRNKYEDSINKICNLIENHLTKEDLINKNFIENGNNGISLMEFLFLYSYDKYMIDANYKKILNSLFDREDFNKDYFIIRESYLKNFWNFDNEIIEKFMDSEILNEKHFKLIVNYPLKKRNYTKKKVELVHSYIINNYPDFYNKKDTMTNDDINWSLEIYQYLPHKSFIKNIIGQNDISLDNILKFTKMMAK